MTVAEVTQAFLDSEQYASNSILNYEAVYGEDFVSPGGRAMARELIARMGLKEGSKVLDVGCGLGGSAFLMARDFGLRVDGIDLSANMIEMARSKLEVYKIEDRVCLELGDCLELNRQRSYDGIYSRDVFLHIQDKARLFKILRNALKPQGRLLFTDYCCSEKPWSEDFSRYVEDRSYSLNTLPEYSEIISDAGFADVQCSDWTDRFIDILRGDIQTISGLEIEQAAKQNWSLAGVKNSHVLNRAFTSGVCSPQFEVELTIANS